MANDYTLTQTGSQIQADLNLLDSNSATAGQVLTANGSGGASWQPKIPTITIALSQVQSQDPLEIQLTNEQYNILLANDYIIFDTSALGEPTVSWRKQFENSSSIWFSAFGSVSARITVYRIVVTKSTKIGELVSYELGKDYESHADGVTIQGSGLDDLYGSLSLTGQLPYLTTAPSANNTSGYLRFVVLSSEPATKYSGYVYIITS